MTQQPSQQGREPFADLPDPSDEEIRKYNLEIQDFAKDMDEIEVDVSENE